VTATTVTSTLDWTNVAYGIRAIAYNGANGTSGTSGTNGSATFVVTRTANDSSAPTNAETTAVIGRNPVAGDIVTVNYNAGNNAVVYRYTTSWVTQATYLTGSLIVDGTITAQKLSVTQLSAISANLGIVNAGELIIGSSPNISGNQMTGSGCHIYNDGRFAVGNATRNLVFNSSGLFLNGFSTATSTQFSNVNLVPTWTDYATFVITKTSSVFITIDGNQDLKVVGNLHGFTVNLLTSFALYTSSNVLIGYNHGSYSFNTLCYLNNGIDFNDESRTTQNLARSIGAQLTAGTIK
jgi:hypothetical protein